MDIREIQNEIARLERAEATFSNCEKLAVLYTIRDGLQAPRSEKNLKIEYSYASIGESDFLKAIEGLPYDKVMSVIDEHMEIVKALYPKEYSAIIHKLKE